MDGDRGRVWFFFFFFFGALDCIYVLHDFFFWLTMYFFFLWVYMLGGDTMFLFLFLVSHVLHWLLIYIMRLFMIYVFYFLFCEIKNLFCFTCIFHTCVFVFVECY